MDEKITKVGKKLFDIYFAIGAVMMGILATVVCFTVIMRYFFALSWKELSEFNVTLFAYSTFWGIGVCMLKNEHVIIDILYDRFKPELKRWITVIDYVIVFVVMSIFTYEAFRYVSVAGKQISQGMEIPMKFMYGIMPISGILCLICTVIKIYEYIKAPIEFYAPQYYKKGRDDK